MHLRVLFAYTVFCVLAGAQPLPVAGVVVDQFSRSIRPIVATAEEATAGQAKVREFDFAAAAPDGHNALVVRDRALYVIRRLNGVLPVWRELTAEPASVMRAAWSEDSESLAMINAEDNSLSLWIRVSSEPKKVGRVDLAGIPERIVSLAVARDARFVFAAAQGKESGALYLLKPGQEPLMLMPLGKAGVIRLAGDALFIADRGRNEVLRLTNWERIPNVAALATVGQGLEDPVGFAVEAEKKLLYVASGGTRQVLGIDTQTGTVKETLELDFAPTGMERLGAGPLFALGGWESGAPLLDTRAARAVLVPVNFPAGD